MKVFYTILILLFAWIFAFAQTPPIVNITSGEFIGTVNRDKIKIGNRFVGYEAENNFKFNDYARIIADNNLVTADGGQLPFLTAGAGLSGEAFNGSGAQTWELDSAWLENFVLEVAPGGNVGAFANQFYFDTRPSVNPYNATETKTSAVSFNIDFQNYSYDVWKRAENHDSPLSPNAIVNENEVIVKNERFSILNTRNIGLNAVSAYCFTIKFSNFSAIPTNTYFLATSEAFGANPDRLGFGCLTSGGGVVVAARYTSGVAAINTFLPYVWDSNVSYKCVIVFNPSAHSIKIYINNSVVASATNVAIVNFDSFFQDLTLGAANSNGTNITFSDIRIFVGKEFNSSDVSNYSNGLPIDGATVWLGNNFSASGDTWLAESYARQKLNHLDGRQNAEQRTFASSVNIDVPKLTAWTDIEAKVIRKSDGKHILWGSTIQDSNYITHPTRDPELKIFYTVAGSENDGREWIERNDYDATSNYAHAQGHTSLAVPTIGGVVMRFNLDGETLGGTSIKEIFDAKNADEYSFVYLLCSPTGAERTKDGAYIWRPFNPFPTSLKKAE